MARSFRLVPALVPVGLLLAFAVADPTLSDSARAQTVKDKIKEKIIEKIGDKVKAKIAVKIEETVKDKNEERFPKTRKALDALRDARAELEDAKIDVAGTKKDALR